MRQTHIALNPVTKTYKIIRRTNNKSSLEGCKENTQRAQKIIANETPSRFPCLGLSILPLRQPQQQLLTLIHGSIFPLVSGKIQRHKNKQ
jgi:hypothetical protein